MNRNAWKGHNYWAYWDRSHREVSCAFFILFRGWEFDWIQQIRLFQLQWCSGLSFLLKACCSVLSLYWPKIFSSCLLFEVQYLAGGFATQQFKPLLSTIWDVFLFILMIIQGPCWLIPICLFTQRMSPAFYPNPLTFQAVILLRSRNWVREEAFQIFWWDPGQTFFGILTINFYNLHLI